MPAPMMRLTAEAMLNVRLRNSRRGMAGSSTRRSTRTNTTPSTTAAADSPTMSGEPQACSFPPQVVTRTRHTMAADRTVVPSQSMRTRSRRIEAGSTMLVTTRATRPIGRLT